ncbi:MAG: hypothetical protein LUE27_02760 [Clostridia bacterium]|nr:hypothetical protein [Clostridia bacterium]
MAKSQGSKKTTKKRRKYLKATSEEPLYKQLGLTLCGRFSEMDIGVLGLPKEIVSFYRDIDFNSVSHYLDQTPENVWHLLFVYVDRNKVLDTLDDFFVDYFESVKKAYEANPVPIYKLIEIPDLKRYINKSIWSLIARDDQDYEMIPKAIRSLEQHGIISMYELLKLNLHDFHSYTDVNENEAREFLSHIKSVDVEHFDTLTTFCAPMKVKEDVPVIPPFPVKSKARVSAMIDDALAGDDVSTEGLSDYDRTLYSMAKAAADLCGSDFYFDVADNPDIFRNLGEALVRFSGPMLEMMDLNYKRACLYNKVPEGIRPFTTGLLYQYRHPQDYFDATKLKSYMRGIDPDMPLEEAYMLMDEKLRSAQSIGEYNRILFDCNASALDDIMEWVATISIERAVDECVYKLRDGLINRDRWKDNPLICAVVSGRKLFPAEEEACRKLGKNTMVRENACREILYNFRSAKHDLFAAMFLMNGNKPVTKKDLEKIMSKEAAHMVWNAVKDEYLDEGLYIYSRQADAVMTRSKYIEMYSRKYLF